MKLMKLKNVAVSDLRRELARREKGAVKLQKKHGRLAKALAAIERSLMEMGVGAMRVGGGNTVARGRRGPGRPKGSKNKPGKVGRPKGSKNEMSLVEAILKGVRAGSTVSAAEAGAAAKKVGYKSSSPNFGMMVANALSKDSHFNRIERGQYKVVGGAKASAKKPRRKAKSAGRKPGKAKAAATTALAEVVAR
jgi:hypothetical protein